MKRNKTQERLIQIMLNKNIKPKIFSDKFLLVTIDVFNDEGRFSNNEKDLFTEINPESPGFILVDREMYEMAMEKNQKKDSQQ